MVYCIGIIRVTYYNLIVNIKIENGEILIDKKVHFFLSTWGP